MLSWTLCSAQWRWSITKEMLLAQFLTQVLSCFLLCLSEVLLVRMEAGDWANGEVGERLVF